jgi:hypothetical protein
MSLFREFVIESEEITKECLENDWIAMKVPKMDSDEERE